MRNNGISFKTVHLNTYKIEEPSGFNVIGSLMHKHVVKASGSKQVPNIMAKGNTIGGNFLLERKLKTGELATILNS